VNVTDVKTDDPSRPKVHVRRPHGGGRDRHSHVQILKSTALIGGSSAITIAFGIVRNKAMAVLLGPGGVGLLGLYTSIAEVAQSVAGMGIPSSGVRQIAEAVGTGETERIARTARVLRRVSLLLGLLGGALVLAFARPISRVTFGGHDQAAGVALLSVAVLFRLVSGGQTALIQGLRRISDLARINVLGALAGTLISIPLIYVWRTQGVVPSLVVVAGFSLLTSWWYARQIKLEPTSLPFAQLAGEAKALLALGVAFMASAFLTMGTAYAIRIIVFKSAGVEAAGLYQAAWQLGGLYVTFILQAMGADFYPRLTGVARDDAACNRLVNEQAHISLLLAGPGVIGTLTLAPLVLGAFYSTEFHGAVDLLRWICLGMMLRVIAWPMGFIVVAKGAQQLFLWTEIAASAVHVGLAWILVRRIGLDGAGVAFFGLYVWHSLLIYAVVRRLCGFRWTATNVRLAVVFLPVAALTFVSFYVLPSWLATVCGILVTLTTGAYSARTILQLVPYASIPRPIRTWLTRPQSPDASSTPPSPLE
jgi:PST family polysaccharide transporter